MLNQRKEDSKKFLYEYQRNFYSFIPIIYDCIVRYCDETTGNGVIGNLLVELILQFEKGYTHWGEDIMQSLMNALATILQHKVTNNVPESRWLVIIKIIGDGLFISDNHGSSLSLRFIKHYVSSVAKLQPSLLFRTFLFLCRSIIASYQYEFRDPIALFKEFINIWELIDNCGVETISDKVMVENICCLLAIILNNIRSKQLIWTDRRPIISKTALCLAKAHSQLPWSENNAGVILCEFIIENYSHDQRAVIDAMDILYSMHPFQSRNLTIKVPLIRCLAHDSALTLLNQQEGKYNSLKDNCISICIEMLANNFHHLNGKK